MTEITKKRILVLHYTQTGQLAKLLDSVLEPLHPDDSLEIDRVEIKVKNPFPFPWSKRAFFNVFPETYLGVPVEIETPGLDPDKKYDLILLGWQAWYLSPSLPVTSFLKSGEAADLFRNTPVVTISACRNMWIMAYEKLRTQLLQYNSVVYGNIALVDPYPNLVSVLTVVGWMIHGKKENYKSWLPPAGVSDEEIRKASRFGDIIRREVKKDQVAMLNQSLLKAGSVKIKPDLMILEARGNKLFGFWARYIRGKEGKLNEEKTRLSRLKAFSYYLPIGIFILSPIASLLTRLVLLFNRKRVERLVRYYTEIRVK